MSSAGTFRIISFSDGVQGGSCCICKATSDELMWNCSRNGHLYCCFCVVKLVHCIRCEDQDSHSPYTIFDCIVQKENVWPCRFSNFGCTISRPDYVRKLDHEKSCLFRIYRCRYGAPFCRVCKMEDLGHFLFTSSNSFVMRIKEPKQKIIINYNEIKPKDSSPIVINDLGFNFLLNVKKSQNKLIFELQLIGHEDGSYPFYYHIHIDGKHACFEGKIRSLDTPLLENMGLVIPLSRKFKKRLRTNPMIAVNVSVRNYMTFIDNCPRISTFPINSI